MMATQKPWWHFGFSLVLAALAGTTLGRLVVGLATGVVDAMSRGPGVVERAHAPTLFWLLVGLHVLVVVFAGAAAFYWWRKPGHAA
jgi:hypothetical protein